MAEWLSETAGGVTLAIKVVPRAARDQVVGVEGDALKVRLNAPPVEGRANEGLVKFLAKVLDLPRANIEIVRGETARHKVVRVRGATAAQIRARLEGNAGD